MAHPKVLPLLGVKVTPFQLISSWISDGGLLEYIENHSDADRAGLVGLPAVLLSRIHTIVNYPISLMSYATHAPAMLLTGTSMEHFIAPNPIAPLCRTPVNQTSSWVNPVMHASQNSVALRLMETWIPYGVPRISLTTLCGGHARGFEQRVE